MAKIEKLVWGMAEPIALENSCSIYDVEYVKEGGDWYLRVYIDKDGGVTTDDCVTVSRALSDLLDIEDPISQSYYLEVSSPGLDRKLSRAQHFADAIGKEVDIKLYAPFEGKKSLSGTLLGYQDGVIAVRLEDENELKIEKSKVADIRLSVVI